MTRSPRWRGPDSRAYSASRTSSIGRSPSQGPRDDGVDDGEQVAAAVVQLAKQKPFPLGGALPLCQATTRSPWRRSARERRN
jgi:hypothetical protein